MNPKIFFFALFISLFSINNSYSNYAGTEDLELFLMRKGSNVKVVILSNDSKIPLEIVIERKSTAPLSKYRKVLTLNKEQIEILKTEKKLILTDLYPESRQLDSYYRIQYSTDDVIIKRMPAVYLEKASGANSITFGDHIKDETMFETEEEKNILTYEDHGITFNVKSEGTTVVVSISGGNTLKGSWFIERKSAKPLASFRRIKVISNADRDSLKGESKNFVDKYPESRKLDTYYRLMVQTTEGETLAFPSVLLPRTSNSSK